MVGCLEKDVIKGKVSELGYGGAPHCSLCLTDVESHSRLSFECQLAKMIWRQLLDRNGIGITRPVLPLAQEFEWAMQYKKKGRTCVILYISCP